MKSQIVDMIYLWREDTPVTVVEIQDIIHEVRQMLDAEQERMW